MLKHEPVKQPASNPPIAITERVFIPDGKVQGNCLDQCVDVGIAFCIDKTAFLFQNI
jgi:hypothetical protein